MAVSYTDISKKNLHTFSTRECWKCQHSGIGKILAKLVRCELSRTASFRFPQPLTSTSVMRLQKCAKLCTRTQPKFL